MAGFEPLSLAPTPEHSIPSLALALRHVIRDENRMRWQAPVRNCAGGDQPWWLRDTSSAVYFAKHFSNRSRDRLAPSSVSQTDLALVAGSEM